MSYVASLSEHFRNGKSPWPAFPTPLVRRFLRYIGYVGLMLSDLPWGFFFPFDPTCKLRKPTRGFLPGCMTLWEKPSASWIWSIHKSSPERVAGVHERGNT